MDNIHPDRLAGDVVSFFALIGVFIGFLPAIASLGALAWYGIQIWESKTVQGWRKKKHVSEPKDS